MSDKTVARLIGELRSARDQISIFGGYSRADATLAAIDRLLSEFLDTSAYPNRLDVADPGDEAAAESLIAFAQTLAAELAPIEAQAAPWRREVVGILNQWVQQIDETAALGYAYLHRASFRLQQIEDQLKRISLPPGPERFWVVPPNPFTPAEDAPTNVLPIPPAGRPGTTTETPSLPRVDGGDGSSTQARVRATIAAQDHGDEQAGAPGSASTIISKLRGGGGSGQSLASMASRIGGPVDRNRYAHGKRGSGTGDGLPTGTANPASAKSTTPGQAPQPRDNNKDSQGTVRDQGRPDPKPTDSSTGPKGGTGGGGGGTGGTPTSPQNPNPPSAPGGGPAPTDGGSSGGSTPTQPTTAGGGSSGSGGSTGGSSGGGGGSTGGTSGGGTSPSGRSGSGGKGGGGSQPKPDPPKPERDPNKTDKGKSQPKAPTKDPPPDPKKHGNSNPNPEDSGSGSGGPRASGGQNENPSPEDGGGAGGPRTGAASRERPGDDDSSGIYYRRRGPGGGLGGPRAYDAYPDPESSGGVGPKARYERPNPEDTGSPHGPSARTAISWSSATRNRMV